MIVWIEKQIALAIHDRQLAEHGGTSGVHDETLLESALVRPQQLFAHGDPAPDLAASLAFGLARNHPFADGNKRTAYVCYRVFLELNGIEMAAGDEDKYTNVLALAEGRMSESEFATWLRKHIQLAPGQQVHEARAHYGR